MNMYAILADAISSMHLVYMFYVVFGQLAILVGWPLGWRWIRNPWFRITHLVIILIVAVEALYNYECPLTTWELKLRVYAGQLDPNFRKMGDDWELQDLSLTARIVRNVLFCDERWQNVIAYSYYLFAGLVLTTAVLVPPRFRRPAPIAPEQHREWRRLRRGITSASLGVCLGAAMTMIYLFALVALRSDYFPEASVLVYQAWGVAPYLLMGCFSVYWRRHFPASLITMAGSTVISPFGLFIQYEAFLPLLVAADPAPLSLPEPRPEVLVPVLQIIMIGVMQGIVFGIAWLESCQVETSTVAADVPFQGNAHESRLLEKK